jgi:hypothetical protein
LDNTTGEDIDAALDPISDRRPLRTHIPNHPKFASPSAVPVELPRYLQHDAGASTSDPTVCIPGSMKSEIGGDFSEVELSSISPDPTPSSAADFNEDSAEALVGERFYDDDFGWCRVTGFGTEAGHLINFWTAEVPGAAEEWSTFAEVSVWVSHSKSRQGKRASTRKLRK